MPGHHAAVDDLGPAFMAEACAKRPGLYNGRPVTFSRVTALIHGFDLALLMVGDSRPLLHQHRKTPRGRTAEAPGPEVRPLQTLVPVLPALFAAARQPGRT